MCYFYIHIIKYKTVEKKSNRENTIRKKIVLENSEKFTRKILNKKGQLEAFPRKTISRSIYITHFIDQNNNSDIFLIVFLFTLITVANVGKSLYIYIDNVFWVSMLFSPNNVKQFNTS